MEDKIIRLPQEIVLKIAAGEVVERPSSIVKELVENSIDAGASAITVEIQDGGIQYIRVVDNGSGIPESMLALAFERHSTSKLKDSKDLFNIRTLGFRGEALASIAAVSKVKLVTKHIGAEEGISVNNEGGVISDIMPAGRATGTTIVVKELFYNTPVRLKFLKKPSIEAGAITDLVMRLILSNPHISFRYVSNGKTVYHSVGDGKLSTAVSKVYDLHTANEMKPVDYSAQGIVVKGFVGVLDLEKSNRTHQTFFINRRYFRNEIISNALEDGARGYFTISKFPMCVLNIITPYSFVDVNVHPNKLDVRFADNELIFSIVKQAVEHALQPINIQSNISAMQGKDVPLLNKQLIDDIGALYKENTLSSAAINAASQDFLSLEKNYSLHDSAANITAPPQIWTPQNSRTVDDQATSYPRKRAIDPPQLVEPSIEDKIKLIGVLFDSFILLEYEDKLLLIDQHAAQERINFERMMLAYSNHTISQALLSPILIELNAIEADIIREYQGDLYQMGFDVGFFDESSIAVRAVPVILGEPMSIKACLHEIFQTLGGKKLDITSDAIRTRILQSACKHSIKAGEKLPRSGVVGLVKQMFEEKIAPTCPHGRPIIVEITKNELYKKFKRIQ